MLLTSGAGELTAANSCSWVPASCRGSHVPGWRGALPTHPMPRQGSVLCPAAPRWLLCSCGRGERSCCSARCCGQGGIRRLWWLPCPQLVPVAVPSTAVCGTAVRRGEAWSSVGQRWGCSVSASAGGGRLLGQVHRPTGTSPRHGACHPTLPPAPRGVGAASVLSQQGACIASQPGVAACPRCPCRGVLREPHRCRSSTL